ncbi:B-box zinc finger protein 20-like [Macadamia integrifolia]|uniref:B-box zinc finger protein 20-like n=1 Tax=Macadamia integrifolia TaxID=60698 RepID=UPI001C4EEC04|nr:B-box zinc finger protein 20-like [Macadamia integrifolia]
MKIQCDVCNREEASIFCSADEAALCHGCDHRVHYANKLAGKHHRFPLLHPSSKDAPRCDICQERRGFLFCREDRAILCRDCDLPIHTANEYTTKHQRFILTGVKLSSFPSSSPTTTTACLSSNGSCDATASAKMNPSQSQLPMKKKKPNSVSDPVPLIAQNNTSEVVEDVSESQGGSISSISEYLIETLPGWQVDDLLDSSAPFGFSKTDFPQPFHLESNLSFSSEEFGIWVPEVPQAPRASSYSNIGLYNGFKVSNQTGNLTLMDNKRRKEDALTVPQIRPP